MKTKNTDTDQTIMEYIQTLKKQLAQSEAHNKRLNEELPKMRAENQRLTAFLQNAAAYLRYAFENGTEYNAILTTLAHDISGLANDERCFLPRVSGYAEAERKGVSELCK
jgi:hypothetical protein